MLAFRTYPSSLLIFHRDFQRKPNYRIYVDGVALPAPLSTTDGSHLNDPSPEDPGLDMMVGIADTTDGSHLNDPSPEDAGLDMMVRTADILVPHTPFGKRKERPAQQSSVLVREVRDVQRQEKTNGVLHDHVEEEKITSPSKGKIGEDREVPSSRWLDMIKDRNDHLELKELVRARINTVFPIIIYCYCTTNKDINDIVNWAPCILRKVRNEQYEVLDQHEHDQLEEDLDWGGDDGLSASWSMYYKLT